MKNKLLTAAVLVSIFIPAITGCQKNSYYHDSGATDPKYDGTVLQYLENNPYHLFDSVATIIKLAGMEDIFQNDSITFFAPTDTAIINSVQYLNQVLLSLGNDTITDLSQISSDFWRQELSMHLFKGVHRLKDYPQVDILNPQVYGGQYYASYDGKVMFAGVNYSDAGGVKYAGYRQLYLGYFSGDTPPSPSLPALYPVASSDINPRNGIVHVLNFTNANYFGFSPFDFVVGAMSFGFHYK